MNARGRGAGLGSIGSGLRAALRAFRPPRDRADEPGPEPGRRFVARYALRRGGKPPRIEVRLPAHPTGASAVLVHGGGFVLGSRRMPAMAALASALLRDGIAVVAFDYRTFGRGGRFAEGVEDTRAALAWWLARATTHGLDADRVTLCGLSAGAALGLAALGAGPPDGDPGPGCRAAVGVYGVYDFAASPAWAGRLGPRLLLRSWDPDVWARCSPCRTYTAPLPTLLLHGEADTLVPIAHSERLAALRQAAGLPVELRRYPGEPHAFLADPARPGWAAAYGAIRDWIAG